MKQIRKLVFKCFCVLLPFVVLWCYMRQHMLAFVDIEAPYYIWNREKTNSEQEKYYRVIILGDSTTNAAYAPEALSRDTLNLAMSAASTMENYYVLRDWLDHHPAPEVCYISFWDVHFKQDVYFWMRTMYSHRFRLSQNLEMLEAAISYKEPFILTEHYWLDFLSYQLYLPNKYIASFMNASFNQRYKTNSEVMRTTELHGGRYVGRSTTEYNGNELESYEEFRVNPLFDEYYRKTIELCIENGITPRIVKLPLPEGTQFTDQYRKEFEEYYEELRNAYPSLTVDWFPAYPKDRYYDTHHMNSHGSLQFSLELKERYPEDFRAAEPDAGQLAAIDDSIKAENKIEWILKWISGKDYTVLFYDQRGNFQSMYKDRLQEDWAAEAPALYSVPVDRTAEAPEAPLVWGISGTGEHTLPAAVLWTEEGLTVQLDGEEPRPWVTASSDVLGVIVINNYNQSIVCMKSFRYVDEAFTLAQ